MQTPESDFDGKRLRKSVMRKTVDYNSSIVAMLESRVWQRDERDRPTMQPDISYASEVMPPQMYQDNPINAVVTKFVRTSTNKQKVSQFLWFSIKYIAISFNCIPFNLNIYL